MADEDPISARRALEAEAERLRAKRLGGKQRDALAILEAKAEHELRQKSISAAALRKALSRPAHFWLGGGALGIALLMFLIPTSTTDSEALTPAQARNVGLGATAIGAYLLLHHYTAILRARLWLKRLPFQTDGFERTLGYGMFYRRARVSLEFADTRAPDAVLHELATARLGPDTTVTLDAITSGELSSDSANFPAAHFFRKAVKRVVLDVHRAYPVSRVTFSGSEATEFYHGSGD